ncbi:MAG: hypothetical protein AAF530_22645 [Pseudomonadota bacterium]
MTVGIVRASIFGIAMTALLLAASWFASGPVQAAQEDLGLSEIERAECELQTLLGFETRLVEGRCGGDFYFPSSAAFRCNLYQDAGYPSELMEKVCALFHGGSFSELLQGATSIE